MRKDKSREGRRHGQHISRVEYQTCYRLIDGQLDIFE